MEKVEGLPKAPEPRWYVVEAKPHEAKLAHDELSMRGFQVWRPIENVFVKVGRGTKARDKVALRPLFDPYIFVETIYNAYAREIVLSTRGVNQWLELEGVNRPQPLPIGWLAKLIKFLADRRTVMEQVESQQGTPLKPGETVTIINGILAERWGNEMVKIISVDNRKRQRIFVQIIGASHPVGIRAEDVVRAR